MTQTISRSCIALAFTVLAVLVFTDVPAIDAGPPPKVHAAVPDAGEQDTTGLDVTIEGQNFDDGSTVAFWRTRTTNPGGVEVTNVRFDSPNQLVATINIPLIAEIDNYDIAVTTSRGRRGKGIEKFRVIEKIHPNCGDAVCQGNEEITCPQDCTSAEPDAQLLATVAGVEVGADGYFGEYGVCGADLDGDGNPEVVVGDPGADKVFVFSTETDSTSRIQLSELPEYSVAGSGGNFGYWVANAGDFDGDGREDIVVGAPYFARGKKRSDRNVGKAYVFGLREGDLNPRLLFELEGEVGYAYFGRSVAGAGDFDGDLCDDIVIGAAESSAGEGGWVYVFSGICGAPPGPPPPPDLLFTCQGPSKQNPGNLGLSVAGGLEIDSCDADAIVVGGYWDPGSNRDIVFAYCGVKDGAHFSSCEQDSRAIIFEAYSDPPGTVGVFGQRVAAVGNFDGDPDGNFEIAISNPVPDGDTSLGWVYVCDARRGGDGSPGNCDVGGGQILRVEGERVGDRLGSSLSGGDFDGDGYADVVAGGSVDYAGTGDLTTMVKVIFGAEVPCDPEDPDPCPKQFDRRSVAPNTQFGRAVSGATDFTGDGVDDILVGAHFDADGGKVYLYSVEAYCGDGICGEDEQGVVPGVLYCPLDCP